MSNPIEIGYYPGCALHGSSNDYEASVRACMNKLHVELQELDDWLCCGATAAHNVNKKLATALPARNLAIAGRDAVRAEREGKGSVNEILAPCPMCSMNLIQVRNKLRESATLRAEMADIVECSPTDMERGVQTEVLNLIQIFQKVGIENLVSHAVKKLDDYKPACYYGCLLVRPSKDLQFDDCEHPCSMEEILHSLGAEPIDWNYKVECCGSGLTLADDSAIIDLSGKILLNAKKHGANCMVVACPMCHVNLDMKQPAIEKKLGTSLGLPVYYLSDLIGIALGISEQELQIDKHFVNHSALLAAPL